MIDSQMQENLNQPSNNVKVTSGTTNQSTSDKSPNTSVYTGNKKDDIKILPTVVPVLGYTTAAPPNIYPPMDGGVQFVTGTQPTQPTSFPTTYQQGVSCIIIMLMFIIHFPLIYKCFLVHSFKSYF